ncbi:ATP-binding cassette domain-containing protein [Dictyobacter kobayashii]|uniref:ABC transporter ATP-binding protein n=1 Tax=Dictyobacter kobayashii TaxID=2014872 RepID=A0A402APM6_9CHLR|nr:ATP-binding cassette domain-containing protein [Dictyobacter kobayashii]GCE21128.1 ABC transporter ATP-binding protein [Dictyobacter kobayashii]
MEEQTAPVEGVDAIRVEGLAKSFGPVKALRNINLHVKKGEILGLVGDNGAGKSTLIKIITGYIQPDAGTIFINGEPIRIRSVVQARSFGIETVYQDLALVNELSVYHNMFLRRELVQKPFWLLNNREMRRLAREHLSNIGIHLPSVDTPIAMLSGGQRQAIAIARAVYSNARILLLDEPLAAMGAREGAQILNLLRTLRARGDISIIMIAHNYAQVLEICDRVNMLQHGEITFDKKVEPSLLEELNNIVMNEYRVGSTHQQA